MGKKYFKKEEKGFTLIEAVVYVVILLVLMVVVFSFLLWFMSSAAKTKSMREVLDNSKLAMNIMIHEMREAKAVYDPTISLSQLSLEGTNNLPADETSTYIDFFLCGDSLCLKRESQAAFALTSDQVRVTNLSFTKIISGGQVSVRVQLGVEYKNPSGKPEYDAKISLVSAASLR